MTRILNLFHRLALLAPALAGAGIHAATPPAAIYFSEHHFFQSRISTVSAAGGKASLLFIPAFPTYLPWDVAVDPKLGRIFWMYTTPAGHAINSANFDGSRQEGGPNMVQGIGLAIDRVNHDLIWADNLGGCCGNGEIYSRNLLTGRLTTLSPDLGLGETFSITTPPRPDPLGRHVYFGRSFQLFRVPPTGGEAELMLPGPIESGFSVAVDPERGVLYRLEATYNRSGLVSGTIIRSGLDGSQPLVIMPEVHGGDLHLDHVTQRLYWVDVQANAIMSATATGGDLQTLYSAPKPWTLSGIDVIPAEVVADPADLNGDGVVNGFDLAVLLAAWGRCPLCIDPPCPCPPDLDGSGQVNGVDLAMLLASWTWPPTRGT